jgi:integrative and conjugative element protein (TIGR02256 family)
MRELELAGRNLHGASISRVVLKCDGEHFAIANSDFHVPNETGGVLIGHLRDRDLVVTTVTGPGPGATHRPDLFVRDGDYAQRMLDDAFAESGGRDDYVGEWHSHPFPAGPSAQDRESIGRISNNTAYACPHPVLLLCRSARRGWDLEAYQWEGGRLLRRHLVIEDPPAQRERAALPDE